jgi:hypothetical protein
MEKSEVQKALERFRDHVVSISKRNLTNKQKNSSKKLYNSIKGKVKANPNSFELEFSMEEYGIFVDAGVKGANPSRVSKNAKIRGQQAPNSKYRFGSGSTKNYDKFVGSLEKWIKRKGLRLRDDNGKFKKGSYKTLSHIIARNIYNRGIAPSMFFTKPFEAAYKNLPQELIDKYGLDAIELFNEQIDEIIRKNG